MPAAVRALRPSRASGPRPAVPGKLGARGAQQAHVPPSGAWPRGGAAAEVSRRRGAPTPQPPPSSGPATPPRPARPPRRRPSPRPEAAPPPASAPSCPARPLPARPLLFPPPSFFLPSFPFPPLPGRRLLRFPPRLPRSRIAPRGSPPPRSAGPAPLLGLPCAGASLAAPGCRAHGPDLEGAPELQAPIPAAGLHSPRAGLLEEAADSCISFFPGWTLGCNCTRTQGPRFLLHVPPVG